MNDWNWSWSWNWNWSATTINAGLLGLGAGVLYYSWPLMQSNYVWLISRTLDCYIELKWMLPGAAFVEPSMQAPKIPSDDSEINSDGLCNVIHRNRRFLVYIYNTKEYITLHDVPMVHDIDIEYDPEEQITDLEIIWKNESDENTEKELRWIITMWAGPLCNFHGDVPDLKTLKFISHEPMFDNVKKIIVNTEYLKEYVLL